MLRISTALLLFGTGFFQVMFLKASIQVHPGQWVTMCCAHAIHVTGELFWFKQTDGDVPIAIVCMLYTESLQKVEPRYFSEFTKDRFVMEQFRKTTSLTIKNTVVSDSGFYFCGTTRYFTKFGNGTRLEVKVTHTGKTTQIVNPAMVNDLYSSTIFNHSEKNKEKSDTGTSQKDEKSPVSTEECSRDIYFTLTLLFGGIIFFTCIIPLILAIIKENKRLKHKKVSERQTQQQDQENDSVEYAAVNFSNKRHKTAGRHTEDSTAVYSLTLHET